MTMVALDEPLSARWIIVYYYITEERNQPMRSGLSSNTASHHTAKNNPKVTSEFWVDTKRNKTPWSPVVGNQPMMFTTLGPNKWCGWMWLLVKPHVNASMFAITLTPALGKGKTMMDFPWGTIRLMMKTWQVKQPHKS